MNVWSTSALISVTTTDIWTKCSTQHKYHTINTPEWPNSHNLKIQDGGGHHLEFRKNVNNSGLYKIYRPTLMRRWIMVMRRWPGDQMSKPEVNSRDVINKILEHKCVDLSDCIIYLNQIRYRAQAPHYQHTCMCQIHITWKSKMAAAAIFNFGKMSITLDWIKISLKKLDGKMHHGHAEMTTRNSKPEVNSRDVIK